MNPLRPCWLAFAAFFLLASCSQQKHYTLMPTPVLYQESKLDPFQHLSLRQRTPATHVFYATTRTPQSSGEETRYGNRFARELHLGTAEVFLADPKADWSTVKKVTLNNSEQAEVPMTLGKVKQLASLSLQEPSTTRSRAATASPFVDQIQRQLADSKDKEIMIYVHGTKVDFSNAALLTAEVDHFSGRDYVGVAYAWPSHQNIFSYLDRVDVKRAQEASAGLRELIALLSEQTDARRINLLCYSAGGRVTSKALHELHQSTPNLNPAQLSSKYRIGSVVMAAADVELEAFLPRLKSISALAEQVAITMSDHDNALIAGQKFMGGGLRAGMEDALAAEENFIEQEGLSNVIFLDVSAGKEARGFDIEGHHYWYRHPWISSDIILSMRTPLTPAQRGLSPTETAGIWYFSRDYPSRVGRAARKHLAREWR